MLKPAYFHKEALLRAYQNVAADPRYQFWHSGAYIGYELDIKNDSWASEDYVSVDKDGNILGFFAASIVRETRHVTNLSLIKFQDSPTFIIDVLTFFRSLRRYRKVIWSVAVGNPAEKAYDKLCARFGGRVVGVFKKERRLMDGKMYDVKWYEIENKEYKD